MTYTFSILHTSARPGKWHEIYRKWLLMADKPQDVEYVLVTDPRWGFDPPHVIIADNLDLRQQDIVTRATGRMCYVDGVNRAASLATGRILIVIADDQYPTPAWDSQLLRYLDANNIDITGDFVIRVNTGTPKEIERNIVVAPVMSRKRYDTLGYVFYPGYESMYADNDLAEHAQHDGALFDAPQIYWPHRHPFFTDDAMMDDQYRVQNRKQAYDLGAALLQVRRAINFGDGMNEHGGVDAGKDVGLVGNEVSRPHTIAVCLPGENFSMEWVSQWTEIICQLSQRFHIIPTFTYCSNVHVTRNVMAASALQSVPTADLVLWIDDDNIVKVEQILRLIQILDQMPNIGGVTGWTWISLFNGDVVASCGLFGDHHVCRNYIDESFATADADLIEIEFTGFPFFLMRRTVLEQLGPHPFAPIMEPAHPWGALSEDTAFCARAKDMGIKFLVDRMGYVPHLKRNPVGPKPSFLEVQPQASTVTILPAADLAKSVEEVESDRYTSSVPGFNNVTDTPGLVHTV